MAVKLHFGQNAFLIHIKDSHILVGEGPSFIDVEIAAAIKPDGIEEKKTIQNISVHKKKEGIIIQLPENTISYIHETPKKAKEYEAEVIILNKPDEKLINKLKPKLCILMNNTVYTARELNQKTGTQVIAVQHGATIDLADYNALSKQKALSKFR